MPYVTDPGGLDGPGWEQLPASVRRRLVGWIVELSGWPEAKISPETTFHDLAVIDSLDTIELVLNVEQEFGITIPDADAEEIQTVEQAAQYISSRISKDWVGHRVVAIVGAETGLPPTAVDLEMAPFGPLDSPEMVGLIMRLEEEFDLTIPDTDVWKLQTVGQTIAYIQNRIREK